MRTDSEVLLPELRKYSNCSIVSSPLLIIYSSSGKSVWDKITSLGIDVIQLSSFPFSSGSFLFIEQCHADCIEFDSDIQRETMCRMLGVHKQVVPNLFQVSSTNYSASFEGSYKFPKLKFGEDLQNSF